MLTIHIIITKTRSEVAFFFMNELISLVSSFGLSVHVSFALKSRLFRQISGALVMLYGAWTIAPLVWMI
jgi:hypothetical protein